ncbi:MAG: hypothetical protein EU539_04695 [Promethearchaeota archaeon]|nr:MAG: hypothetical protein EU539_04695 [Candidatus Lokiarchaeota archaeon]
MSKKLYVCKECGFVFPEELYPLIESKTQVYCEQCGTPFSSEGIQSGEAKIKKKKSSKELEKIWREKGSSLRHTIKVLNYISWIPILILSIVLIFSRQFHFFLAIFGLLIVIYDLLYVSKKIKKEQYDEIVVDSFCLGILGSFIFGSGVIMLIKGVFIVIHVYLYPDEEHKSLYLFGLKLKDSLNHFSAFGCFLIILSAIDVLVRIGEFHLLIQPPILVFFCLAVAALIIDLAIRKTIYQKSKFFMIDSIGVIFIGILGTLFFAAGIFIIIKGVIIFFLSFGNPPILPEKPIKKVGEKQKHEPPFNEEPHKPVREEKKEPYTEKPERISIKKETIKQKIPAIEELKAEEIKEVKKEAPEIEEEEIESRLHESLLPVKNEKDKKLVKEYFSKIFNLLSKDLRNQINELNISKNEKKELLEELAFLSKKEQVKYIEAIVNLYQEELPIKLIERVRSLPNVRPEHLVKIAEQLKFMDVDEQEKYIQFLENNA